MQRYFLKEKYNGQTSVNIMGEDVHHIVRVMRMKVGDKVWIVFEDEVAAEASIARIEDSTVEAAVHELETVRKELPVFVTIASGLPKGDKLEWIIQKGTELGASQFVPFIAGRSIVKWEEKKGKKKIERWEKIAKEAAEQSHRQRLPIVHPPVSFKDIVKLGAEYEHKMVAYEEMANGTGESNFAKQLAQAKKDDHILIVFGPEGGLTEEEARKLEQNGFEVCGLGPRILRTETAPLYALSAISYQFELMR